MTSKTETTEMLLQSAAIAEGLYDVLMDLTEGKGDLVIGSAAFLVGLLEFTHSGTIKNISEGASLIAAKLTATEALEKASKQSEQDLNKTKE